MSEKTAPDITRLTALRVLDAVLREKHGLDEAMEGGRKRLKDSRDRAFLFHLVMVVMRHLGEINFVLETFLDRQPKGRAKVVVRVLQLGIAQVLFMDVPGYAAANTTVNLVRRAGFSGHAKLVNAIMRRVAEQGPEMIKRGDQARLNTPTWLWQSWINAYGEQATSDIAHAHSAEPVLDISVKNDPEGWADKLQATVLPTGTLRLQSSGMVENLTGYEDGQWWVQDAGAALPVRLLGNVEGQRVADLCAAPGGKTAQLASAGAHTIALDRSSSRMKRLISNMRRLGLVVETVVTDAKTWQPDAPLDAVLLDAPCSATGTIRRHPDVAISKSAQDVASLAQIQHDLLQASLNMVRPGGLIVFCTCSLQPEEGVQQITQLLDKTSAVKLEPITPDEVPGLSMALQPDGTLRTLPSHWVEHGGIDGFFVARLRRVTS